MDKLSIVNNINDPNVLFWLKNNMNILEKCNNVEELMSEYQNYINGSTKRENTNIRRLVNGTIHASNSLPKNEYDRKAAYVNWYGIIVTLVLSFAIGYLIAWAILKIH